jgi:Zn ribbon nucleic-acid-binding protein
MADRSNPSQWVVCPVCHQRAAMISDANSNTYECEQCGHTWTETPDSRDRNGPVKTPSRSDRSTRRIFN